MKGITWNLVHIFKNERVTAFPANPCFRSKSAEHDVTLTSFTADLSKVGRHYVHNLCKIVAREGIENVVIAQQKVWETWRKNERGAMDPPNAMGRGLKEIVHLRKNAIDFWHNSFSLCYQKQTLAVIILLHSFIIISFIKTINRTTQLHQPITFDYFGNISQSLKKWIKTRKRSKTIFAAEKANFFCKKVFSDERFRIKGVILHELQYGYLCSKPHVEGEYFLKVEIMGQGTKQRTTHEYNTFFSTLFSYFFFFFFRISLHRDTAGKRTL